MQIDGIPEAKARLAKLPDNLERFGMSAVRNNAQRVVAAARAHVAVRTGRLRGAISVFVGRDAAGLQISGNAPYWMWVEYGTSKAPATPFIRPAVENDGPQFDSEMTAAATRAADEM